MGRLDFFIGFDYSGAQTPTSRLKALQAYAARAGRSREKQHSPERDSTLPTPGRYDLRHAHKSSAPANRVFVEALRSSSKGVKN